MFADAVFLPLL